MEEIHTTTRDEYGLKATGFLHALEKFNTLFGIRLAHTLFSAAEQVSLVLQRKDICIQDAFTAVDTAKTYYHRLRSEEIFNQFFDATVQIAGQHLIGQPALPRYRRHPARIEEGSGPHQYPSTRAYYRHIYFEACDHLLAGLEERFDNQRIASVLKLEQILLKIAYGEAVDNMISVLGES